MDALLARARHWASRRVILLNDCDDAADEDGGEAAEEIAAIEASCRALDMRVSYVNWERTSAELHGAQIVLPLHSWSYATSSVLTKRFCTLLRELSECGARPRADLRTTPWIVHKGYMLELRAGGVPIVPTEMVSFDNAAASESAFEDARGRIRSDAERNADGGGRAYFVVKPAVGGGGDGVERVAVADATDSYLRSRLDSRRSDMLMQPFLSLVTRHGELALVFVNEELLHAVRKDPAGWDAAVSQPVKRCDVPPPEAMQAARLALSIARSRCGVDAETPIFLARVDLLPSAAAEAQAGGKLQVHEGRKADGEKSTDVTGDGDVQWLVSEVEIGWPHLFLRAAHDMASAASLVAKALLWHAQSEETMSDADRELEPHGGVAAPGAGPTCDSTGGEGGLESSRRKRARHDEAG